jgi:fatty acid desaturase
MNKFIYNRLLLIVAISVFIGSWVVIFNYNNSGFMIFCWITNVLCLHYLFTVVHQSSHNLLSPHKLLNYMCGYTATLLAGITFADFKFTHDLHHKHIGDPTLDPDHAISGSGPVLLIPFKIFYHDYYFMKYNNSTLQLISYCSERFFQVMIMILVFGSNQLIFITYWLIPMLLIGFANALFLFYFPHYKHWIEATRLNIPLIKDSIQMSRVYHHKHHDNPSKNSNFFPFEDTITTFILKKARQEYLPFRDYFYKK